jgi:trans-2,3-dihydro-3-hydroxyanthranilate isomerase
MSEYRYRIVNVFTRNGGKFTGNPLAVFEDGTGLSTETMQALARQMNLSETTFILPSTKATAGVRIFTPAFEMPFAGHPTLGTAHVVRSLKGGVALTLDMKAGVIPVNAAGDRWTLSANKPSSREVGVTRAALADTLGLTEADIGPQPLWVNTGSEQLIVPVTSLAAVDRCSTATVKLGVLKNNLGRGMAYVFHDDGKQVTSRFFFPNMGAVLEDPATGSACANLGGWFVVTGAARPLSRIVSQGEKIDRPSTLLLDVDASGGIFVGGEVVELARGTLTL